MQRQIGALLCKDRADCTEWVGTLIESELTGGNVQEAFRHLKRWYQATLEMQAKPCFYTMERQTSERVDLHARRLLLGDSSNQCQKDQNQQRRSIGRRNKDCCQQAVQWPRGRSLRDEG
jgi:hypothetical protein